MSYIRRNLVPTEYDHINMTQTVTKVSSAADYRLQMKEGKVQIRPDPSSVPLNINRFIHETSPTCGRWVGGWVGGGKFTVMTETLIQ